MRRNAVPVMLALALAVGCSSPGTTTGGPGAHARPPRNAATVRITQVTVGSAVPTEGAYGYVQVDSALGATLLTRRLPGNRGLTVQLRPGGYRLESWQRTCDANCGNLDPPSDRCARTFTARAHQKLDVTIRVNFASGCVIILGG